MTSPASFADHLRTLPPSVGATAVVGIDGFSGAGKTALAQDLGHEDDVDVVSIEEFYRGWAGLEEGPARAVAGLVEPLRAGRTPRWRAWDWERGEEGPELERPLTARVVVLEGCGAGATVLRAHEALTVWVDAEPGERERRLRAREDWPLYAPHRATWRAREQVLAAHENLPDAADVIVRRRPDGSLDMRMSRRR
ncbi:nucleoside/nucleotide kinase family protein [Actinomycetospora sp. C-140]